MQCYTVLALLAKRRYCCACLGHDALKQINSPHCYPHRDTAKMLKHAKELYDLASRYPGSYQTADPKSCLGVHKVRCPRLCVSCINETRNLLLIPCPEIASTPHACPSTTLAIFSPVITLFFVYFQTRQVIKLTKKILPGPVFVFSKRLGLKAGQP